MHVYAAVYLFILCIISADSDKDACSNSSVVSHFDPLWRPGSFKDNFTLSEKAASQEPTKGRDEVMSYESMPELFALDHFERCISRPGGTYCLLDVELANVPGQLYDYIMEYSSLTTKRYFRGRLHRGVCVSERCGLEHEAVKNGSVLLACLNGTIFQETGLQVGQVKIHYCNSADTEIKEPDTLDRTFDVIIATIFFFVITGTIHHMMVQAGKVPENKYAMAFSLIKNWKVLTSGSGANTYESLQGLRFLMMLGVISGHAIMVFAVSYVSNPDFMEGFYDHPLKRFTLNGNAILQTFFVMSGFLLSHHVFNAMDTNPLTLRNIPSAMLYRIARLLPVVLVTVGLMATWAQRMGSGPQWDLFVGTEHLNCRANWWRNLFFIQNYCELSNSCLAQTWYISADTQLFLVSLLVLSLVVRYRTHAGLLLGSMLALSVTVSALQTYWMNIQPVRASLSPESFMAWFAGNRSFAMGYISAQANWTGNMLGMLTAYIHYQVQKNKWDLQNSQIFKWMFYASPLVALYAVSAGAEFHSRAASRTEAMLFNALDHNLFGAAMCVFILGCIYKCDKILRGIVEWGPLQPLGRLSFCALLLHSVFLRMHLGQMPGLIHGTMNNAMFLGIGTTVLTYALSVVLFLLVEQPACQLQKIFFGYDQKPSKTSLHTPEPCSEGIKEKDC